MRNSEKYPEAWAFYIEHARNIENESDISHIGKYRIPYPNGSGRFIYTDTVEELWTKFMYEWYKPSLTSESVHGKIQYIVETFK